VTLGELIEAKQNGLISAEQEGEGEGEFEGLLLTLALTLDY